MRQIEDIGDLGSSPAAIAERWHEEIVLAEKKWDKYKKRLKKITERYIDETENTVADKPKKLNVLWANIETIKPALYNQTPKPEVGRRNKDKDPVGREAAEVIERGLAYCNDAYDFDGIVRDAVHDYALGSVGLARVIYDPLIQGEALTAEYAKIAYVSPNDFLTNDCRRWDEVRWVGFRQFFTRAELRQLSPMYADHVSLDHSPDDNKDASEFMKKALVWEIWDKETGMVYYIARSFKDAPLKVSRPFCDFKDFFPLPRPMMGVRGGSIVPTPDYVLYQDQAALIDELTNKIYVLTKALKVAGVYNGSAGEIAKILDGDTGNIMIPVSDWSSFIQGGGSGGAMQFMPIKEVADTLLALYQARSQAKQDMYEATGLSDIVRGASDPNETATAQAIKNQWGSLRVRDRQKEVQRFARDLMRLKAEVIAEKFSIETLRDMSGMHLLTERDKAMLGMQVQQIPPEQQAKAMEALSKPTWEQVDSLLKNDKMRSFSIDIETDSTIEPNEQQEKAARVEFITALGGFLSQMGAIVQQAPETAPMMGELLTFGVRGFKVGSELESTIESTMEQVRAKMSGPPQPDIEQQKLQLEAQKSQKELALKEGELKLKAIQVLGDAQQQQIPEQPEEDDTIEVLNTRLQQKIAAKQQAEHAAAAQAQEQQLVAQQQAEAEARKAAQEQADREERRQGSQALMQGLYGIQQAVGALIQAVQKPKEVVRGEDGLIKGVK